MRVGDNPNKFSDQIAPHYHHVIIPVYIPTETGYFSESFEVLKLCLQSLFRTTTKSTFITIVNNGSCEKVSDYLWQLKSTNIIDELISTANIGKINSVLKGLSGTDSQIFTVADQDVLFCSGWQEATREVFESFPKAGVVGIVPMINMHKTLSYNTIIDNIFSDKLIFRPVLNPEGIRRFYQSIWVEQSYNRAYLKQILTLKSTNGTIATVGSGHFVCSYRRDIFLDIEKTYTSELLSAKSDREFLDLPPLKNGYYRLSTYNNFAYHMGNRIEAWMYEALPTKAVSAVVKNVDFRSDIVAPWGMRNYFSRIIVHKIIFSKAFYRYFLKCKGLDPKYVKNF